MDSEPKELLTERALLAVAVSLPDLLYCRGFDVIYKRRQYRMNCPGHADSSNAIALSWAARTGWRWQCRDCRLNGDAVDLIQRVEKVGVEEAMAVAKRYVFPTV